MARANSTQSSFLGGEWSPLAQGRTDLPAYPTALNVCRNGYPTEEGGWTRRPGFVELGKSYFGSPDTVSVDFNLATGPVVYLEETFYDSYVFLRFWTDLSAIFAPGTYGGAPLALLPDQIEDISSISTDSPALLTVGGTPNWATGTVIQLYLDQSSGINAPGLVGRQLVVTNVSSSTFTLTDMVTGDNIDGSTTANTYVGGTSYATRPLTIQTIYTSANDLTGSAALTGVRIIQTGQQAIFVSADYEPYALSLGGKITSVAGIVIPFTFTFATAGFIGTTNTTDGPYSDPPSGASQTGNSLGSVDSASAPTSFTITDGAYDFVSTDLHRQIRLWTQPAAWDSGTSYSVNDTATFSGVFYTMTASGVPAGTAPNQAYTVNSVATFPWVISPQLGGWIAGAITAVNSTSNVTIVASLGAFNCTNLVVDTWQLGLYTTGAWPSCGTYHEGRLFLAGLFPGRFDFSAVAPGYGVTWYQPTDYYGNETDANAIAYTCNTPPQSNLIWAVTDVAGVIAGTSGDEWLISAPETNGALSPSNIQAKRISRYGSAAVDPIRAGLAIIFVQTQQRQLIEYIPDPFANRYVGWRLNTLAKHLTTDGKTLKGIIGVTYQEEPTPILWTTLADNSLIGCTYRRQSTFGSEPPFFFGWHRHDYGYAPEDPGVGKTITGGSPGPGGSTSGSLVVSTNLSGVGYLEIMSPITASGNLDGSPAGWITGSDNNGSGGGGGGDGQGFYNLGINADDLTQPYPAPGDLQYFDETNGYANGGTPDVWSYSSNQIVIPNSVSLSATIAAECQVTNTDPDTFPLIGVTLVAAIVLNGSVVASTTVSCGYNVFICPCNDICKLVWNSPQ